MNSRHTYCFDANTSKSEQIKSIQKNNILPNIHSKVGDFHWFFGYQSQHCLTSSSDELEARASSMELVKDVNANDKFQLLANLGLLPDNDILSNKLINIYGKRIYNLLHDKSQTLEKEKSFRKKVAIFMGIAHEKISSNKQMDIHVCWNMVQKIRAIQTIDTLLNTSSEDFLNHYEGIMDDVIRNIQSLKIENQRQPFSSKKYINDIYSLEAKELDTLQKKIDELKKSLQKIATQDQYHRNQLIQDWQRNLFITFNENFKVKESKIGLHGQHVPLPNENVSNSNSLTDAEYAIQKHIYQEWRAISSSQLWQNNEGSRVMASDAYCHHSIQRKQLLFGACLSESIHDFKHLDKINADELIQSRILYQDRKKLIQATSLKAKSLHEQTYFRKIVFNVKNKYEQIKHFILPQSYDPLTGLKVRSAEWHRYIQSFYSHHSLDERLENALATITLSAHFNSLNDKNPFKQSAIIPDNQPLTIPYAPVPDATPIKKEDDVLTAILDFSHVFFLFFDRDLMAKRPYVSMFFFSIPFIQVALPALAGSSAVMAKVLSVLLSGEAALAKYSGLNALLHYALHKEITAAEIEHITEIIREAANWFTHSEGMVEQALVGSVVAKLIFNIADVSLHNPWTEKQSSLLSEFLDEFYAGSTLEGTTTFEHMETLALSTLKVITRLAVAAYTVGALEHFVPILNPFIHELANVPWEPLIHPKLDISLLQTIGTAKSSALVLLKTFGVMNQLHTAHLVDINGISIRKNNASHKVLKLFLKLTFASESVRRNVQKNANYPLLRQHFEELLAHNPPLLELYRGLDGNFSSLKELGIHRIIAKRRHKLTMAFLKTIPAGIKMVLGLIPAILITLPTFIYCGVKGTSPLASLNVRAHPYYQYGLASLNLWSKVWLVGWTLIKAVLHSFAQFALRSPEICFSIMIAPFFILTSLAKGAVAITCPKINPIKKATQFLLKLHEVSAGFVREHFRYPIERATSKVLTFLRNIFIRKVEREFQVLSPVAEKKAPQKHFNASTFNVFLDLEIKKFKLLEHKEVIKEKSPKKGLANADVFPKTEKRSCHYHPNI